MKKILFAAVAGMIVYFLWGLVSWTVLQLHDGSLLPFPDEASTTVQALEDDLPNTGVYYYPPQPEDMSDKGQVKRFSELHEGGPIFSVFYLKEGRPVMDWRLFLKSAINYFLLSFLLAFALRQVVESLSSWVQRVLFVTVIGVVIALATYVDNWIWLYHPLPYVVMMSVDLIIRWLLLGMVIAFIIKPERKYKVGSL